MLKVYLNGIFVMILIYFFYSFCSVEGYRNIFRDQPKCTRKNSRALYAFHVSPTLRGTFALLSYEILHR